MQAECLHVETARSANSFDRWLKIAFSIEPGGTMLCKHSSSLDERNPVQMKPDVTEYPKREPCNEGINRK